jgi:predicted GNAT family acetyltransferase
MADDQETVQVSDNKDKQRYEAYVGPVLAAYAAYEIGPGGIVFLHTKTEPAFEGRGIASHLAEAALDDARRRGLRVTPQCPFFASYIDRHSAYADLVDRST